MCVGYVMLRVRGVCVYREIINSRHILVPCCSIFSYLIFISVLTLLVVSLPRRSSPIPSGLAVPWGSSGWPRPCPVCLPLLSPPKASALVLPGEWLLQGRLHLTCPLCPQKPATVDPPPSLLCGPLLVSDGGTAWSKVWAAISESDSLELVLHLRGGSQVCPLSAGPHWGWGSTLLRQPTASSPRRPDRPGPCSLGPTPRGGWLM